MPRGLLGVHALDVLSQTPDNADGPHPHCGMASDSAGFTLGILLCVRFVVVVLVSDLSLIESHDQGSRLHTLGQHSLT